MNNEINVVITPNVEIITQLTNNESEIKVEIIGSGPAGKAGISGVTPIKGIDYFTQADIDEISALAIQDKNFVHTQTVADSVWVINHDLAKYPSVMVVDSAGTVVIGQIDYNSINQITLTFFGAFSGKAYLN